MMRRHDEDGLQIADSPSLAQRTTLRLGGRAIAEVRVRDPAALERLADLLSRLGGRCGVLGQGSDIIAADGDLPLVLVRLAAPEEARLVENRGKSALLRVNAGMRLPALLARAAALGLAGLEGLCGIPGSVGGALAVNAGSFGVEFGSLTRSVGLFSPLWGMVERGAHDFAFGYRSCELRGHSGDFVIHAVTLELAWDDSQAIRARMREIFARKRRSQPVTAHSAGCVFKNPAPDMPAGRLLDEAGLRGMRLGGMAFSPAHANFLVNEGGGTFAQAMELIERARARVRERCGLELELEVRIWR
jgi:UDP-N-acetylmuramate dehydrogenase